MILLEREFTGQRLHGRYVYQHENFTQSIFYLFGEFDGWLLGPTPDLNFGGIKNSHDRMCVHTEDNIDSKAWGYYDGPRDTKVESHAVEERELSLLTRIQRKPIHIGSMMTFL